MISVVDANEAPPLAPLRDFVTAFGELVAGEPEEATLLAEGRTLLASLVARDDWLPDAFARPHPDRYQQYLLHCDSQERFSIVSFVWGPGQSTPIHDHQVWGLIGVLRGAERAEQFDRGRDGRLTARPAQLLTAGMVETVGPAIGDIHRVANGRDDAPSVSIHVYGANIGAVRRFTYAEDGTPKPFISGYANSMLPNLWDRSKKHD